MLLHFSKTFQLAIFIGLHSCRKHHPHEARAWHQVVVTVDTLAVAAVAAVAVAAVAVAVVVAAAAVAAAAGTHSAHSPPFRP